MPQPTKERRRRRTPKEAEREILDAAEAFLRERPFRDLTIDEVMDRTGLSRPSFYVYFRDRHHLALRLMEELGSQMFAGADRWLKGEGDPAVELRRALETTVRVYAEHGRVLRAIADAATEDATVERAYRLIAEQFAEGVAARIASEPAIDLPDPRRTAGALVWMNERFLAETLGREPRDDPEAVLESLFVLWSRALHSS
jgi:TetR/AcrR family transcriptional regulator, ethionamide resistance regulator